MFLDSLIHRKRENVSRLAVHVDGSEAGRRRLQFAVGLAQRTGGRLSGLHVMPTPEVPPLYKPSQVDAAVAHLLSRLPEEAVRSFALNS